jgi:hypothetical protein
VALPISAGELIAIVLSLAVGLERLSEIDADLDRSKLFRAGITGIWHGLVQVPRPPG